jgi:hypothetical protein
MEAKKYYYKGHEIEILDLFEDKNNGKLVAVVEYVESEFDDDIHYYYTDKIEEKTVKF